MEASRLASPNGKTAAPVTEYHQSIDALDRAIVKLTAKLAADEYALLVMVREFDERAGWLKWGLSNCPEWLHWRCDLSLSAAREKVRVAHALKDLPEVSAEFARGALTYSKVRALTRVATPANEEALLAFALRTTAARVEERCRQMRNVSPASIDKANRAHAGRRLSLWRDEHRGTMTLSVEVPIEQGEIIDRAIDKAMDAAAGQGPEFEDTSWQAQRADALVALARGYLGGQAEAGTSTADHYQVIVHVDGSALKGGKGRSDLPVESTRRLTCDGSIVAMTDGPNGEPLDVGRRKRTVSTAIRRALWARDGGCAFPGCTHTRYLDAHHVIHWADGGPTSVNNTMLLCTAHHRLVHEGGYAIRKDHRGQRYFRRPDGRAVPTAGYRTADMIDDDVGIGTDGRHPPAEGWGLDRSGGPRCEAEHPSAEGCGVAIQGNEVRESAAEYPRCRSIRH